MLASFCCDPLEKPCPGGLLLIWEGGGLEGIAPGTLVSVAASLLADLPALPATVDLEIRSQGSCNFVAREKSWSLYLDCLDSFDLGRIEEVLEAAAQAGCDWVVAAPVLQRELRYRLYSLVRLLCDRLKLKFSIFEDQELEAAERLNHYLANQRGCCRFRSLRSQRV